MALGWPNYARSYPQVSLKEMTLVNHRVSGKHLVILALRIFIATIFCCYTFVLEDPTKQVSNHSLTNTSVN